MTLGYHNSYHSALVGVGSAPTVIGHDRSPIELNKVRWNLDGAKA